MMDNRTGQFETAETMAKRTIGPQHRGPAFRGGETVTLRGADITLRYVGPSKLGNRRSRRRKAGR